MFNYQHFIIVTDSAGVDYCIPSEKYYYFQWMDSKYVEHRKKGYIQESIFLDLWDKSFYEYEIDEYKKEL